MQILMQNYKQIKFMLKKVQIQNKRMLKSVMNCEWPNIQNSSLISTLTIDEGVNFASALFKIYKDNHSRPVTSQYFNFSNRNIDQ